MVAEEELARVESMVAELKSEMISGITKVQETDQHMKKRRFINETPKNGENAAYMQVRRTSTLDNGRIIGQKLHAEKAPKKVGFIENNFKIVKELSQYVTLRSNDHDSYAVKKYSLKSTLPAQKQTIVGELLLQRCLSHPNLAEVFDAYSDNSVILVTKYAGENLRQLVGNMTEPALKRLFTQVCLAVEHLHALGLVHGRITAEHVVVEGEWARLLPLRNLKIDAVCPHYKEALGSTTNQSTDIFALSTLLSSLTKNKSYAAHFTTLISQMRAHKSLRPPISHVLSDPLLPTASLIRSAEFK